MAATVLLTAAAIGVSSVRAADQVPVVGPGATKEEVINAYGWPNGQSQSGTKEILTYPQGRITIENGRVEKVDFLPNVPWPAPRPRPGPASPTSVKKAEAPPDFWLEHFEDAQREATRRNARILALFIGSDWSPPSRQFQDEVAFHPDFVNAFTGDFVFLRLDFPTRTAQPAEIRDQNNRLRTQYGVTTYPALLVLSPAGTLVATVDLTKPQAGDSFRARVIAAIRDVRDLLIARPPPPDPVPEAAPAAPAPPEKSETQSAITRSIGSAFSVVTWALVLGLLLVFAGWWLLWRKPRQDGNARAGAIADRISDAANGLPAAPEIAQWSKEKLRVIVARLAESDGYEVKVRDGGGDGDLALYHKGEQLPGVIVNLQPGTAGSVSLKRLRELFGTITVEGVKTGWFVSPMGFTGEARDYAREHHLVLIDAEHLLGQMRAMPPILLRKILSD